VPEHHSYCSGHVTNLRSEPVGHGFDMTILFVTSPDRVIRKRRDLRDKLLDEAENILEQGDAARVFDAW
jgi:hypothetical protein